MSVTMCSKNAVLIVYSTAILLVSAYLLSNAVCQSANLTVSVVRIFAQSIHTGCCLLGVFAYVFSDVM